MISTWPNAPRGRSPCATAALWRIDSDDALPSSKLALPSKTFAAMASHAIRHCPGRRRVRRHPHRHADFRHRLHALEDGFVERVQSVPEVGVAVPVIEATV